MNHQLQLPLPIDELSPQADRSRAEVEEDNRVISALMQRFDLTEEEAAEFYFTRIKPRKRP